MDAPQSPGQIDSLVGFNPETDSLEKTVQEGEVQNWPPATRGLQDTEKVPAKARADLRKHLNCSLVKKGIHLLLQHLPGFL